MTSRISTIGVCISLVLLMAPAAWADSSALIINGIAGSPEHEQKFKKWAEGTRDVLVKEMGYAADRVVLLAAEKTAKPSIESAFAQLKQQVKPDDTFVLFLIGHGSSDTDYKLNISGADLKGVEYSKLIDSLGAARSIIVSSTPASGAMFESMAGKNRVVVAASRSGEKEDTVFYEHFLTGLRAAAADEDKDKRVSVWEAFKYAASGVDRFYKEQTRLVTEHAGISANGAEQVAASASDQDVPVLARVAVFNADRAVVVSDPRLQVLLNEKKDIEQKIETLRLNRALLLEAEYDMQLEDLVIQLSRKNAEIREQESR